MTKLGDMLAEGATAEVYAYGEGRVVKLFRRGRDDASVDREWRLSRMAHDVGLPAPAVGERIDVDDRLGFVLERVDGPTMQDTLERSDSSEARRLGTILAELHADMHACGAPDDLDMPTLRDVHEGVIRGEVDVSRRMRKSLLGNVALLANTRAVCHGDFYPNNIILAESGPVIIDWCVAFPGDPLADHARTWLISRYIMARGSGAPREAVDRCDGFWQEYFARYRQLRPYDNAELGNWIPSTAAVGLAFDSLPDFRRPIVDFLERTLANWPEAAGQDWATATL